MIGNVIGDGPQFEAILLAISERLRTSQVEEIVVAEVVLVAAGADRRWCGPCWAPATATWRARSPLCRWA